MRLLEVHHKAQNGTSWDPQWEATPPPQPPIPQIIYVLLTLVRLVGEVSDGELRGAGAGTNFVQLNVQETIVILEELNHPHPRFPACDMFLP